MEVYVNIRQKATINPLDVVDKLRDDAIGFRNWFFEKDGKYYRGYEVGAGSHSWDDAEEISKELYDYLVALDTIKKFIEKKSKKA
jgi:hypothetical protein